MSAEFTTGIGNERVNQCGCCEGLDIRTPVEVYNRSGLSAIAYRVGTHAAFKRSMLARLTEARRPALDDLNTRDDDDAGIALLDAWATVADVLTFYQERIANESYLRTASERLSLLQLARLIGYELATGVAAETHLAFGLEDAPGAPLTAVIPIGTRVQSLPGQNELPQVFETVERIEARVEWNELKPRMSAATAPAFRDTHTYLKGVTTNLRPGDPLLIVSQARETDTTSEQWEFRRINTVTPDSEADRTRVSWRNPLGSLQPRVVSPGTPSEVYALRTRASIFGHSAPGWDDLPVSMRVGEIDPVDRETVLAGSYAGRSADWADAAFAASSTVLNLDAVYPEIVAGSWIVLTSPAYTELYRVANAAEESKADFAITAKTTRLTISGENIEQFSPRSATVYARSERLEIAEYPISSDVEGSSVALNGVYEGFQKGQMVLVSGTTTADFPTAEAATLAEVPETAAGVTELRFVDPLQQTYQRETVTIRANIARATHGEARREVLGSGDAGLTYQRFTLHDVPLTHRSAATVTGTASTLEVRVNDLLWQEVPALYGCGPNDRVYIARTDDDGKTTVTFGDGVMGSRLPTGQENVRAVYRKGIGLDGGVRADQLSLLMTRPLGVRKVSNPLRAFGAQDPQSRDDARQNAPTTVLTLGRIVSLHDYADFARTFAGIARALATWTWDGRARGVFLTVAGPQGADVPAGGDLLTNLVAAIRDATIDPHQPLTVRAHTPRSFQLHARVKVAPEYLPERVLSALDVALRHYFGFEQRAFGQSVALSEVIAVLQRTPGVVAVDVNTLYRTGEPAVLNHVLPAALPEAGAVGPVKPAELLTLSTNLIELEVML
ncbi:MAG: putative baseplate assembly protein [Chloroflexota bacterium]|nr:putative baseplate assembly protein [Chloroflexota bacterium]